MLLYWQLCKIISYVFVGEDSNSNELIYYTNITAKTHTIYSSSLYNKSSFVTDYYYWANVIEIIFLIKYLEYIVLRYK